MTVGEWVAREGLSVPAEFREWMEARAPGREVSAEALADEAETALTRALGGESRVRRGAFDLLVADGFLTWACQQALESPDPESLLHGLMDRFVS